MLDPHVHRVALAAIGFMPDEEGVALYESALDAPPGPFVEIGSYCGKSAVYLGAAARAKGNVLFSIDHHRGSEEQQAGAEYYDARLVDPATGEIDTLPFFRRTITEAGLDDSVIGIVGRSEVVATAWSTPLALVFIDGGHSEHDVYTDYSGWARHIEIDGLLVFHDIYPDPAEGGQAPLHVYEKALASGAFSEVRVCGSLRVLKRGQGGFP